MIVVLIATPAQRSAINTTIITVRSEEHTSELQSHLNLVCRLLLEKKNSKLTSFPFEGGVAFVEIPAETTPGIVAIRSNNCPKYAARSTQLTCAFWCTGVPTDITLCGS